MMLRVTKLSQLASMSSKLRFWRLSGMSMPVALRQLSSGTGQEMYTPPKEEVEEGIEKAENEGEEEETDLEGEHEDVDEEGPPIIRKTLKKYQSVILNEDKALEALTRDFENLRKGANYGPFSFNKKLDEVTDEELSRLQNEAFDSYGNARDMRGRLNGMIKNLREPDFPDPVVVYQEIEDIVFAGLSTGEYKVIMDQDFEFLVSQKGFIPYLGVFFDRKFIDENPTIYTDRDLSTTLGLIVQDPAYMPLLELIKFIKPRHDTRNTGNLQKHIEQFLQLYGSSNQYNYFQLIHHLFSSLKATALQSIDFSLFTQKLLNVYWGQTTSKAAKQRFREHLHNLLFVKLNIQENQTLSYYFADMFLTASRYEDGLKIVGLTLLIINRLLNNPSACNDLYLSFVQKFGQEKFTFYIKEKLPAILSLARKKKLADSCRQTVESFLASEVKHGELKPVVFDILDQGFYRADSKILYAHENNTVLDFDTSFNFYKEPKKQSPAKENEDKVQQLKEVLYHDKPQEFIKLFWEECQQTQEGKALFNEISKEYVKDPKLITKLTDEKAYGFLTALSRHMNQNFYEGTFEDTYLNKVVNAPYISYNVRNPEYQFQQTSGQTTRITEKKPFTNFIGSKNTSEGAEALGQAPKRSFSTTGGSEKPAEKSNPFKDFLKKAEEVDKTVKEQKITQEGIDQMKKTLFTEKKREKDDIQFAEIKTPKLTPVQPKVQQVQPPKATFVLAPNYWENIIGEKTEVNEIINAIENSFLTSNDPVKAMGAIHSFVTSDPFATKGIQNHKLVFYKMFNQPTLKKLTPEEIRINALESKLEQMNLEPSPKLHLNIETNFGIVEKDYNKYLTSNLFHYNLGDAGYQSILECLKDDYKRRYFKKCVSHMARFGTEVSIKNLELIADICYESKAGLTLIESAQLLIMNGLLHRPDQLAVIVNKLRLFKDLSDSCEHLAKSFAHYTGLPLSIEFLGPHLDLLMRFGKKERFMTIFDRLKDYLNNKKFKYDENLSAEENLKLQDKFKQENKLSLAQLYREYIEKLNSHNIYTFSKLLLKEQNELKLSSTSQDYINSLRVHKDNQAELEKILEIVKASEDNDFVQKALDTTLNVVTESGKRVKTIMPKVLDTFIYSHKIFPTRDLTHRIAFAMTRTTDASPLDKFVKFLEAEGPPLKYGTKILFLRLLNISEDAMLKSQQLAVVEHLFSKEVQERIKQREEKKQQRKAERKEALPEQPVDVKFAQIVQEKPVAPTKAEVIPEVVAEAEGEKKESKKEKKAKKANEKKQEAQVEAQKQAKEAEEKEKVSKTLREPEGLTSFLITSKAPRKSRAPKRVPGMTSTQRWRMEAYKEIGTASTKKPEGKEEKK